MLKGPTQGQGTGEHGRSKDRKTDNILAEFLHCIVLKVRRNQGGLAQLEERVLCKHEVIGSSPIFSTTWADSSVG